tara:strand:+ start:4773 stop:6137 length:1365 start_codon:yes stop_codon:yes gene_type:complete
MDFFGQNRLTTRIAFEEKALFKEYGMSKYGNLDLSDFLYKNPYYGKIDNKGYSIIPNTQHIKPFRTGKDNYGLDFVVDAYEAFRASFIIEASDRGISTLSSNLIKLVPTISLLDFENLYYQHTRIIFEQVYSLLSSDILFRKKACDYKSFLNIYFWFLEDSLGIVPFTRTGFALSHFCAPNISGLVIDLQSTDPADNDLLKKNKYIDDPLFDAYVRKAAQYGFSVDKNVPWRLVARINEPEMQFFLKLNGSSRNELFEKYYLKTYIGDYNNFKQNSIDFYNSFIEGFPQETYAIPSNEGLIVHKQDRYYANQKSINDMGEVYWLEKYFHFKYVEKFSQVDKRFKNLSRKYMIMFKRRGLEKTLEKMEKMFSKQPLNISPEARKQMFNYGYLSIETAIYSGKELQDTSQKLTSDVNLAKAIASMAAIKTARSAAVSAKGTGTTSAVLRPGGGYSY